MMAKQRWRLSEGNLIEIFKPKEFWECSALWHAERWRGGRLKWVARRSEWNELRRTCFTTQSTWLCISLQYFWWQMLTQGRGEKKKHLSLVRRLCDSQILFATSPRSDYISLNALRHIFLISGSSLLVWGNDGWFIFSKCHNKNFLISTLIEVA